MRSEKSHVFSPVEHGAAEFDATLVRDPHLAPTAAGFPSYATAGQTAHLHPISKLSGKSFPVQKKKRAGCERQAWNRAARPLRGSHEVASCELRLRMSQIDSFDRSGVGWARSGGGAAAAPLPLGYLHMTHLLSFAAATKTAGTGPRPLQARPVRSRGRYEDGRHGAAAVTIRCGSCPDPCPRRARLTQPPHTDE